MILLRTKAPRLAVGFLDKNLKFSSDRFLKTDFDQKVVSANVEEGLLGWSVRRDILLVYPDTDGSEGKYLSADPRTKYEVVGPVNYRGEPCGAVYADFFEGEGRPEAPEQFTRDFQIGLDNVTRILEETRLKLIHAEIERKLTNLVRSTYSIRGYVAIRNWDGSLVQISAGVGTEKFMDLKDYEGLCGYVFQTGNVGMIKDTRKPPKALEAYKYVSSDPSIISEIVIPFTPGKRTIAVLNLESTSKNSYRTASRRKEIEKVRDSLLDAVLEYREEFDIMRHGEGFVISRIMSEIPFGELDSPIRNPRDILLSRGEELRRMLELVFSYCEVSGPFFSQSDLDQKGLSEVSWTATTQIGTFKNEVRGGAGVWVKIIEVRVLGEIEAIFAVEKGDTFSEQEETLASRLANATSAMIVRDKAVLRIRSLHDIFAAIANQDLEITLAKLPHLTSLHFDCDHVTLFKATEMPSGERLLYPYSSTSEKLIFSGSCDYYRIDQRDGLTGYAATKKDPVIVSNFRNNTDLAEMGFEARTKAKIIEDENELSKAFGAIQIFQAGKLVFLVRLTKFLGRRVASFDAKDEASLVTIRKLLEAKLDSDLISHTGKR